MKNSKHNLTFIRELVVPHDPDYEGKMWYGSFQNVTSTTITDEQLNCFLITVFQDINETLDLYIDSWEEEKIKYDQIDKALEICDIWMHRYKKQVFIDGLQKVIDMLKLAKELHTCVEFNL